MAKMSVESLSMQILVQLVVKFKALWVLPCIPNAQVVQEKIDLNELHFSSFNPKIRRIV